MTVLPSRGRRNDGGIASFWVRIYGSVLRPGSMAAAWCLVCPFRIPKQKCPLGGPNERSVRGLVWGERSLSVAG
ncbi:hypothetical protein NL676_030884 [Syzygium grande]|nr:hypothetical protein NL676_030884 [Syzygium grande]